MVVESGIRENFAGEIRNPGLWNPTNDLNPEFKFKYWNPVPRIRNPRLGIQSPRLSWIPLRRAIVLIDFLIDCQMQS